METVIVIIAIVASLGWLLAIYHEAKGNEAKRLFERTIISLDRKLKKSNQ